MSFSLGFITYLVGGTPEVSYIPWGWGANASGGLGTGDTTAKTSPVSAALGGYSFIQISGGGSSTTNRGHGLKADGSLWGWGENTSGEIGNNANIDTSSPVSVVGGHSFSTISSGVFGQALKADGSAWWWGNITNGKVSSPVSVVGGHSFTYLSHSKLDHIIALKSDGSAWGFGAGTTGKLGNNAALASSSPVSVVGGHSFVQVDSGATFSIARKADGSCWTWGAGGSGQLGNNAVSNKSSPVSVVGGYSFIQVTGGWNNGYGLKADGSAWAWGAALSGGLGNNQSASNESSPISVVGGHSFVSIIATGNGTASTCFGLKSDGSAWAWGIGASGQLGNNGNTSVSSPVSVVGSHSFKILTPANTTTYALK